MQFVMHSYTFRGYPLEYAMRCAERFGYDGIELQPCHFNAADLPNELPNALEISGRYRVPIACVDWSGDFIHDDPKVVEQSVQMLEQYIDMCAGQNIRLLNGCPGWLTDGSDDYGKNGSAMATDAHFERAAEAFRHLGKYAGEGGVTIVFEIHMNALTDTIASTARLLDLIGSDFVKANPDPGNMFVTSTAERDPEALDQLEGRLGYFHLKNCVDLGGRYDFSVKLADGHINTHRWIEKALRLGYDGPICVEFCGEGDPHAAAMNDNAYIRQVVDWCLG